jgi:hypothetical protein
VTSGCCREWINERWTTSEANHPSQTSNSCVTERTMNDCTQSERRSWNSSRKSVRIRMNYWSMRKAYAETTKQDELLRYECIEI